MTAPPISPDIPNKVCVERDTENTARLSQTPTKEKIVCGGGTVPAVVGREAGIDPRQVTSPSQPLKSEQ